MTGPVLHHASQAAAVQAQRLGLDLRLPGIARTQHLAHRFLDHGQPQAVLQRGQRVHRQQLGLRGHAHFNHNLAGEGDAVAAIAQRRDDGLHHVGAILHHPAGGSHQPAVAGAITGLRDGGEVRRIGGPQFHGNRGLLAKPGLVAGLKHLHEGGVAGVEQLASGHLRELLLATGPLHGLDEGGARRGLVVAQCGVAGFLVEVAGLHAVLVADPSGPVLTQDAGDIAVRGVGGETDQRKRRTSGNDRGEGSHGSTHGRSPRRRVHCPAPTGLAASFESSPIRVYFSRYFASSRA